ncbi:hypothetical protein GCK32_013127, partial [Trichostrongylus colubriformis]
MSHIAKDPKGVDVPPAMTTTKEEQAAEKEGTVLDEFSEQPAVFSIRRETTDDEKISDCKDEQ